MNTTRSLFQEDLDKLSLRLLAMSSEADSMVERALRALDERDAALAEEVIAADDRIDAMDVEIERECIRLITHQQPVARDLRIIGTAMKVITDVERIGDHAVDIGKVARALSEELALQPLVDLPKMAAAVRRMLAEALQAFVDHDLTLVEKVIDADDEVDRLYYGLRGELHAQMRKDASCVLQASHLLFVAHYLERIADHAVNIAERVHYVETGDLAQLAKSHRGIS